MKKISAFILAAVIIAFSACSGVQGSREKQERLVLTDIGKAGYIVDVISNDLKWLLDHPQSFVAVGEITDFSDTSSICPTGLLPCCPHHMFPWKYPR